MSIEIPFEDAEKLPTFIDFLVGVRQYIAAEFPALDNWLLTGHSSLNNDDVDHLNNEFTRISWDSFLKGDSHLNAAGAMSLYLSQYLNRG